jgi:hypothetical protein
MSSMRARLVRLEQRLYPDCETQRSGWCCVVTDPEDALLDALPPTCPHGGRWLLMFTTAAAQARYAAGHPGTPGRSFSIAIDRAYGGEEGAGADA